MTAILQHRQPGPQITSISISGSSTSSSSSNADETCLWSTVLPVAACFLFQGLQTPTFARPSRDSSIRDRPCFSSFPFDGREHYNTAQHNTTSSQGLARNETPSCEGGAALSRLGQLQDWDGKISLQSTHHRPCDWTPVPRLCNARVEEQPHFFFFLLQFVGSMRTTLQHGWLASSHTSPLTGPPSARLRTHAVTLRQGCPREGVQAWQAFLVLVLHQRRDLAKHWAALREAPITRHASDAHCDGCQSWPVHVQGQAKEGCGHVGRREREALLAAVLPSSMPGYCTCALLGLIEV